MDRHFFNRSYCEVTCAFGQAVNPRQPPNALVLAWVFDIHRDRGLSASVDPSEAEAGEFDPPYLRPPNVHPR